MTRRVPGKAPVPQANPRLRTELRPRASGASGSSGSGSSADASATVRLPASHGSEIPPEVAAEAARRASSAPASPSGRPSSRRQPVPPGAFDDHAHRPEPGASPVSVKLGLRKPLPAHALSPDDVDVDVAGMRDRLDEFGEVGDTERFQIRGELGRGSMGAILRGYDRDVRREIAMKVMLEQDPTTGQLSRFLEEGQITGQLEHPNVPPVHEIGVDSHGRLFFTMKLVRGRSLHDRLQDVLDDIEEGRGERAFPLRARLDVFRKVCDAISFAHSRGVLHRDLKPENVMVGEFGEVQVMDWGLAKLMGRSEEADDEGHGLVTSDRVQEGAIRTMHGSVAGTPAYMAPEQARGENATLDERADIYALGSILYELLVFRPPYDGDSLIEVLNLVKSSALVTPSERLRESPKLRAGGVTVPRELEAIVLKAMSPEPRRRYRTVRDLGADVDAWLAYDHVTAHRDSLVERVVKWGRRNPTRALAMAAATLLVLVTGMVFSVMYAMVANARAEVDKQALAAEQTERAAATLKADNAEKAAALATLQAENAEKAAAVERERARSAESDRQRMEAQQRSERAEQERRVAEMRELAAKGELDALQKLLAATINRQRSEAFEQFRAAFTAALKAGKTQEQFVRELGAEKINETIEVMLRAMDAADQLDNVTIDSGDMFRLGVLYEYGTGEFATAEYYYSRAVQLDPASYEPVLRRAIMRDRTGRAAEARADFDKAVELAPASQFPLLARGDYFRRHRQVPEAIADYDAVTAMDPSHHEGRLRKGWLLLEVGELAAAAEVF
ncbi:MAG: protein kinase, partial [Planctomycetota bacterium]